MSIDMPSNEDVGSKSIYKTQEFIELENAFHNVCRESTDTAAKKLLEFDERRKKRRSSKIDRSSRKLRDLKNNVIGPNKSKKAAG